MKVLGIIMEANPFHNGHKYFIEEAIKKVNPDITVSIITTSFSMRGEISLINKFDKTKILLNNSLDIVLELPITQAVQSANYFSNSSILNLSKIGVTDLAFGCEIDDLTLLNKFTSIITNKEFIKKFNEEKNFKDSLKNSYNNILKSFLTDEEILIFSKPNVTLAVQYLRVIKENNLNITPHIIKRIDSEYFDKNISSDIASATAIRNALQNNLDFKNTISKDVFDRLINLNTANQNLINIIKYKYFVNNNHNEKTQDKEGINNYIINNGDFTSLTSFQNSLKNKRYSINRINRTCLYNILNITSIPKYTYYLRILGINDNGLKYLNKLPKDVKRLVFTTQKETNKNNFEIQNTLKYELLSTKLYSILTNNPELINYENKLPIRKD